MTYHCPHQSITDKDVDELVARIRQGDALAMKYLVANNISLILHLLSPKFGWDKYDVMHDIVPYIMKSVTKYDSSKGSFATWLRGSVRLGLMGRVANWKAKENQRTAEQAVGASRIRAISPCPRTIMNGKEYRQLRKRVVRSAMNKLDLRERYLIKRYFYKGDKLRELADEEGISKQAIQQTIKKALGKMREGVVLYAEDLGRA